MIEKIKNKVEKCKGFTLFYNNTAEFYNKNLLGNFVNIDGTVSMNLEEAINFLVDKYEKTDGKILIIFKN